LSPRRSAVQRGCSTLFQVLDLETTNSEIAAFRDGWLETQADISGRLILPSVVELDRNRNVPVKVTTSQPRSLLSIARLNRARSRIRLSIRSRVRIDQTWFGRSGGLAPINLPSFQGVRWAMVAMLSSSGVFVLLVSKDGEHA
jgi:hypothetical protein